MNRLEKALEYHKNGFNCSQSVLAVFSDISGLSEQDSFSVSAGFGAGAATGELCGAIAGGILALGMLTPVNPADPVGSKQKTTALGKELQKRFAARFGALRCQDLLAKKRDGSEILTETAKTMGLTNHCDIMIVTVVEIVEELLAERG